MSFLWNFRFLQTIVTITHLMDLNMDLLTHSHQAHVWGGDVHYDLDETWTNNSDSKFTDFTSCSSPGPS